MLKTIQNRSDHEIDKDETTKMSDAGSRVSIPFSPLQTNFMDKEEKRLLQGTNLSVLCGDSLNKIDVSICFICFFDLIFYLFRFC